MAMHRYYILQGHIAVPVDNILVWGYWMDKNDNAVAKTTLADGREVSTVFLGINHGFKSRLPILFETMVFHPTGKASNTVERYHTWEEAERGHNEIVQRLNGIVANN